MTHGQGRELLKRGREESFAVRSIAGGDSADIKVWQPPYWNVGR